LAVFLAVFLMGVGFRCLVVFFGDRDVFCRFRYPAWVRALAVRMYCRGLSLRRVSEILREIGFRASYEAVRRWFLKAGESFPLTTRRRRGYLAVDERVIHSLAKKAYLWAAREIGSGEIIAVQVSRGRGDG